MNILLLNWRDPKNPRSGGAEKLNLQILKPLVYRGDAVIWYALSVKGLPQREVYQGITIIRFGNILTHFLMWPIFFYSGKFGKIDFIIDSVHGIGYLSNIFAPLIRRKILVCEVARNIWDEMIPFPGNVIGKFLEPIMFFIYSQNKFWTISESTKKDLQSFAIPAKNITVLPMGFDAPAILKKEQKTKYPTALFVGRLAAMKGIEDVIHAIHQVNKTVKTPWQLTIIGRGDLMYEKHLKQLVSRLNLSKSVTFEGFVSEEKKFEMMSKSWVLLVASSREGWGMIVPEANLVGTQVIAYNSPGLRDSAKMYAKENILVEQTSIALANALQKINKPILLKGTIQRGWSKLHKIVNQKIKKAI